MTTKSWPPPCTRASLRLHHSPCWTMPERWRRRRKAKVNGQFTAEYLPPRHFIYFTLFARLEWDTWSECARFACTRAYDYRVSTLTCAHAVQFICGLPWVRNAQLVSIFSRDWLFLSHHTVHRFYFSLQDCNCARNGDHRVHANIRLIAFSLHGSTEVSSLALTLIVLRWAGISGSTEKICSWKCRRYRGVTSSGWWPRAEMIFGSPGRSFAWRWLLGTPEEDAVGALRILCQNCQQSIIQKGWPQG